MKRLMLLALCALLMLGGCAALAESDEVTDALRQSALDALAAMIEGDFTAVTDRFDGNMAAAVSEDALAAGWESVLAQLHGAHARDGGRGQPQRRRADCA